MSFYKPENLNELLLYLTKNKNRFYFLAGGTDINVQLKKGLITNEDIIYINHLIELKGIEEKDGFLKIGALTSFSEIIESPLIKEKLPFLKVSLANFASPLLQNMATIGGNIGNGSPTADVIPVLLVLDAKLELISDSSSRIVELKDYFTAYKRNIMKSTEIIKNILIPFQIEWDYTNELYKKVGTRNALTIAKLAIAGLMKVKNNKIIKIRLAVGSLNEYARRLEKMEKYLAGLDVRKIDFAEINSILKMEITPISDLRSDKDYRFQVCYNLLENFLKL